MPPCRGWLLNSVPSWPAPAVVWLDRGMATVLQVRVPTTARPVPATMGALAVITIVAMGCFYNLNEKMYVRIIEEIDARKRQR